MKAQSLASHSLVRTNQEKILQNIKQKQKEPHSEDREKSMSWWC
jgi:hypothetical protein